ncbi:uncharacterized protein [Nicotiana tomentosiformis]|uniref:uncharacterized protein n=1 Tax=Nicotiana tomentosiformis TaxID=4098 RepID=UPI00388CB74D
MEIVKEVENFENKPKSNLEETKAVNLRDFQTVKETHISIHLSPSEKEEYIRFLREYGDMFAWSDDYMTGMSQGPSGGRAPDMASQHCLNPAKCAFGVPAEKLLGFIVSHRGIELDPSKIKSIQDLPPPKSKKDVLSFLGCLNYIRRFLKLATVICEPIFKIMRKDIVMSWTKECQKAFDIIKEYLSKPLVLVPSEPGRRLLLYLSMLDGNFDCVLGQHDENGRKDQAINYLSKKFTPYEARYSLLGHGAQEQTLADHLTENPVDGEYEPLKTYFPHEKVLFIGEDIAEAYDGRRMFFDRTANFKGIGIEAVLLVIRDSDLLIRHVLGEWAAKNTKIFPYLYCVQDLIKRFIMIELKHVMRVQNEFTDALATLSSVIQNPDKNYIDPIPIEIHKQTPYCAHVEEEFDGNPWFHDIKEYLEKRE